MGGREEIKAAIKVDDTKAGNMRRMIARFALYQDARSQWMYSITPEHSAVDSPKYTGKVKDIKKVCSNRRVICQCVNGRNITIDPEHNQVMREIEMVQKMGKRLQELSKNPGMANISKGQMPTPLGLKTMNSNPGFRVTPLSQKVQTSPPMRSPQAASPPMKSPPHASTPGRTEAASPPGSISDLSPQRLSPETPKAPYSSSKTGIFANSALKNATKKASQFFSTSSSGGFVPSLSGRSFYGNSSAKPSVLSRSGGVRQPGLSRNPLHRRPLSSISSYTWKSPSLTPTERAQPLQGFSNLGNTCYMNAILQSLFGLDTFSLDISQLVAEIKDADVENQKTLFCALHRLVRAKKQHVGYDIQRQLLSNVKSTISAKARRFSGHYQHDAHEFLCQVLDQLKEEVLKISKLLSGISEEEQEIDDFKDQLLNPTVLNFEFGVTHTISCLECGKEVSKEESFHDLSLDMPRNKDPDQLCSIQDALDLFFRKEVVDYICEQCKGQKSDVRHNFSKLPRILVLHLKRYNFMNATNNGKLGRSITIPRYLTLQTQCTQTTSPCFPLTSWMPGLFGSHLKEKHGKKAEIGEKTKRQLNFSAGLGEILSPEKENLTPSKSSYSPTAARTPSTKTSQSQFEEAQTPDDFLSEISALESQQESEDFGREETPSKGGIFGSKRKSGDAGLLQGGRNVVTPPSKRAKTHEFSIFVDGETLTDQPQTDGDVSMSTQTEPVIDCDKENAAPEVEMEKKDEREPGEVVLSEEEQLRQAMANSMSDLELIEQEDEDLRKAKEMSLQEFDDFEYNPEDFGEVFERDAKELAALQENSMKGELPYSYRLMSVVSHLGSSSSAGHYISDVYNIKKKQWFSFDDIHVSKTSEEDISIDRQRTGYIFFYMSKELLQDLEDSIDSLESQEQEIKKSKMLSVMSV